ncbi:hypothetical protein [Microcoleus sp. Z1_C3]
MPKAPYKPIDNPTFNQYKRSPTASPNDMKSDRSPTSPFRDTAVMPCPYP